MASARHRRARDNLDRLDGDLEGATLTIVPEARVPHPARLRELVRRGADALHEGAIDSWIVLADGRQLDARAIRELDGKFHLHESVALVGPHVGAKKKTARI